jgi:hypothetical protein
MWVVIEFLLNVKIGEEDIGDLLYDVKRRESYKYK